MKRNLTLWVIAAVVVIASVLLLTGRREAVAPSPSASVTASASTSPKRSIAPHVSVSIPPPATPTPSSSPTPTVAVVGFEPSKYTTTEGGPAVTITIVRTGVLDTLVSVDYKSSSDTATVKDYTGVSGSLQMGPGETTQTFTIQAFQDTDQEDEIITLSLSELSDNAVYGHQTATLTVKDDDGPQP